MRAGINHINKPDFLMAYTIARTRTMAVETIRNGYAATSLVLYDPERVLSKLNTQLRTLTPPLALVPKQGHWVPETPYNTAQLEL